MWALKTVQKMPKHVRVEWEDGLMANFNYLWLRDNCARRPSLVHLDLNLKPETVNCSPEAMNMVWPPFFATDYSTDFLRANTTMVARPSLLPQSETQPRVPHSKALIADCNASANWLIVPTLPLDPRQVTGQLFWDSSAQEPGTVWPWMKSVPAVCAVESTNDLPEVKINLVDQQQAYRLMAERHPDELGFLGRCTLEYSSEGFFRSRHPLFTRSNTGDVMCGVFNNQARSSTITVEPLAEFYECLQKLGRIFAELTQTVELHPGERLLVDNSRTLLGAPAQQDRQLLLRCLSL